VSWVESGKKKCLGGRICWYLSTSKPKVGRGAEGPQSGEERGSRQEQKRRLPGVDRLEGAACEEEKKVPRDKPSPKKGKQQHNLWKKERYPRKAETRRESKNGEADYKKPTSIAKEKKAHCRGMVKNYPAHHTREKKEE